MKNVQGLRAIDYCDRLSELRMLPLVERRIYLDLVETFKVIKGFDNVLRSSYFSLNSDTDWRPTRGNDCPYNIVYLRCNHDTRRHFFTMRVAKSWNQLPNDLKLETSLPLFKSQLKTYMLSNCLDNSPAD